MHAHPEAGVLGCRRRVWLRSAPTVSRACAQAEPALRSQMPGPASQRRDLIPSGYDTNRPSPSSVYQMC